MHPFKEKKSKIGARFEFATHKLLITQIPDNIPVSNNVQMTISNERSFYCLLREEVRQIIKVFQTTLICVDVKLKYFYASSIVIG